MELSLDLTLASMIFLVGLTAFLIIAMHSLNHLVVEALEGRYYYVRARVYPVKFVIEPSGAGKYVVKSEDGRTLHVYVVVVKNNSQVWYLYEGVTPLEVPAEANDWVIALSSSGYGVKEGANRGLTIVTIRGVLPQSVQEPSIKPYVRITGNHYAVYPEEVVITASGSVEPYNENLVRGYRALRRRVLIVDGCLIVEILYG